jgi:phosphoglycolate phosphatase/pyrophosphatase PpaX
MLFDVDGTLADSLPVCLAAFREAIRASTGREPTEEGMIQRLVPGDWKACLDIYLEAYRRALAQRPTSLPAMAAALERLRGRGLSLGVVTGKGLRSALLTLDHLGLARYFDMVEAGSPEGNVKPASIRQALARWGLRAGRVAYIGDSASDIHAAREAGVVPLGAAWVPTTDGAALRAAAPLETFDTVTGFIRWIEEHVEFTR